MLADPHHRDEVGVTGDGVDLADAVEVGQAVATIEAMKMEATITAQAAGTVRRVVTEGVTPVNGGDLLLVIE